MSPELYSIAYTVVYENFNSVLGLKPGRVDEFFQSVKILSMTSFGREVKS